MPSQLQTSKYQTRFRRYDVDGNGYIEQSDLTTLADRLCETLAPTAEDRRRIQDAYGKLWQVLLAHVDTNNDGRISQEEYVHAVETGLVSTPGALQRAVLDAGDACFRAADRDGSGRLTQEAYQKVMTVLGVAAAESAAAFAAIDRDGDGRITQEELRGAVTDFYTSDTADAPGTYLFGN